MPMAKGRSFNLAHSLVLNIISSGIRTCSPLFQVTSIVGKSVEAATSETDVSAGAKSGKSGKPVAPPRTKEKNGIFRSSKSSGNLDSSNGAAANSAQSARPLSRPTRYKDWGQGPGRRLA